MNLREELKAYVDGELNADQVKEIEHAAASSQEVREEIAALRALKEEFAALTATPEPACKAALLRRLKVAKPVRRPNFMWAYAGVAAALLIGIAIVEPSFSNGGSAEMAAPKTEAYYQDPKSDAKSPSSEVAQEGSVAGNAKHEEAPADWGRARAGSEVKQRDFDASVAKSRPQRADGEARSQAPQLPSIPTNPGRDIIYNGSISLEVPDVTKSVNEAISLVQGLGGYVVSTESTLDGDGTANAYLEVRIPAAKFDIANKSLSKYGKILSQTSSGQDVTQQIAEHEGRTRALAAAEQEYIRMLNATRNTSARLEVRRRLDEVRAEREGLRAALKRMKDLAALSTLSIEFSGEKVVKPDEPNANWWDDSNTGASNALGFVGRILGRVAIYLVYLSPIWIAGLAVWWIARRRATG